MALRSLSTCKGNGFRERPGRSASPVAGLFCLFEVVGTRLDGGGSASGVAPVASPAPDWGCHTWSGSGRDSVLTSLSSSLQMAREVVKFTWALAKVANDVSTCWKAALYSWQWEIRASSFGDLWFMLGCRCMHQVGSVVQLLSLADDTVVEACRLNPLRVIGQGGKGKASLSLEDCC